MTSEIVLHCHRNELCGHVLAKVQRNKRPMCTVSPGHNHVVTSKNLLQKYCERL